MTNFLQMTHENVSTTLYKLDPPTVQAHYWPKKYSSHFTKCYIPTEGVQGWLTQSQRNEIKAFLHCCFNLMDFLSNYRLCIAEYKHVLHHVVHLNQ